MGLIIITGILTLILILDNFRNRINIQIKQNCTTRKERNKRPEREKEQMMQNQEEPDSIWSNAGLTPQSEEKEPPEYESMEDSTEHDRIPPLGKEDHQLEHEIKDFQGTGKSLQKEITTRYPIM